MSRRTPGRRRASALWQAAHATDATYREEFWTEVVADVRQACAVRAVYDALEGRPDRDAPPA